MRTKPLVMSRRQMIVQMMTNDLRDCTRCEIYYCCLLFSTGTLLHFWGSMLFDCNLSNFMLLWFFHWFLFGFHNVCFMFGYPQCLGLSRCYVQWAMHFCKALSWKSLWIKASAKCINVNVSLSLSLLFTSLTWYFHSNWVPSFTSSLVIATICLPLHYSCTLLHFSSAVRAHRGDHYPDQVWGNSYEAFTEMFLFTGSVMCLTSWGPEGSSPDDHYMSFIQQLLWYR